MPEARERSRQLQQSLEVSFSIKQRQASAELNITDIPLLVYPLLLFSEIENVFLAYMPTWNRHKLLYISQLYAPYTYIKPTYSLHKPTFILHRSILSEIRPEYLEIRPEHSEISAPYHKIKQSHNKIKNVGMYSQRGNVSFPRWEYFVPSVGTSCSQHGNIRRH